MCDVRCAVGRCVMCVACVARCMLHVVCALRSYANWRLLFDVCCMACVVAGY